MEVSHNGEIITAPQVWEQRIKCTMELFEEYGPIALVEAQRDMRREGFDCALHLWTFSAWDHEKNLCTLLCWSDASYPDQAVVNAPADKIEKAYAWVIQHNPHLYFMCEPKIGWVSDDFMRNSVTLVDKFKIRKSI